MAGPKATAGRARPAARATPPRAPAAPAAWTATEAWAARHGGWLVLALAAGQALVHGALCFGKYRHYLYTDFDLAIFAHAETGLRHGTLFESIGAMPWLGGHVALVMFLLLPLWLLAPTPLTLLAVQAAALALGAVPVWRLARRETGSALAGVLFAAAYLAYPAIGYTALFEFHPEALATPALLFALDALRAGRLRPTLAWTALALTTREDVALVVLGMAALAAFRREQRWRFAGGLAALAVVSLVVSFAVIMPAFGSGQTDYAQMYGRWGTSFRAVAAAAAREPWRALAELFATPGDAGDGGAKRLYFVQMLLPFAFLALGAPALLLPALPVLLEHFMSSRPAQHTIVFHYTSLVTPFFVAAAVVGAARLARAAGAKGAGGAPATGAVLATLAFAGGVAAQVMFGPIANTGMLLGMGRPSLLAPDSYERTLEPHRDALRRRVPPTGDVVAGFEFLARFTDRPGLHALHHFVGGHYTFSTRAYAVPRGVTAVLGDLGAGSLFKHVDDGTAARWAELRAANGLVPVDAADDLVLFARGVADTITLWSVAEPRARREPPVVYDGEIAFLGSEQDGATVAPGGVLPLRTYWRRVRPTERFHLTEFVLVDAENRPQFQLWRYLGYTQHPAATWPEGASVCETYRLAIPPDLAPGRYHLGARLWWRRAGQGVCEADDPAVRAGEGFVRVASFDVAPRAK